MRGIMGSVFKRKREGIRIMHLFCMGNYSLAKTFFGWKLTKVNRRSRHIKRAFEAVRW